MVSEEPLLRERNILPFSLKIYLFKANVARALFIKIWKFRLNTLISFCLYNANAFWLRSSGLTNSALCWFDAVSSWSLDNNDGNYCNYVTVAVQIVFVIVYVIRSSFSFFWWDKEREQAAISRFGEKAIKAHFCFPSTRAH